MRLTPSPCLVVNHTSTLRQAIEAMQDAKKSYALVDNDRGECVGIFTDRDVLMKFFELQGPDLDRPVTAAMTSPVIMLPLGHLHQAPEIMQQRNIRHVPIYDVVDDHRRVIGVITLDSLAAENLLRDTASRGTTAHHDVVDNVAVVSADGATFQFVKQVFLGFNTAVDRLFHIQLARHPQFQEVIGRYDLVVIDMDDLPEANWKWIISALNALEPRPQVLIALDPRRHSKGVFAALQTIAQAGWLKVFPKPVDLIAFEALLRGR